MLETILLGATIVAVGTVVVVGSLYALYRMSLTTKIYIRITPGLATSIVCGMAAGYGGLTNLPVLIPAFSIAVVVLVTNVVFISKWLVQRLEHINRAMNDVAETITHEAGTVLESSEHLATSASEQAATIEELSATIEELSTMATQNTSMTVEASVGIEVVEERTEQCTNAMVGLDGKMSSIHGTAEKTHQIMKSIDSIAFQTNLLALNAAVEAARAGEHGKGFAVVADEIRGLSLRSADSAKDTEELLTGSQRETLEGLQSSKLVTEMLHEVADGVKTIARSLEEVSVSSKEQLQGLTQMEQAISQINASTQSTSAQAEETSSMSSAMAEHADNLRRLVSSLTELIEGKQQVAPRRL